MGLRINTNVPAIAAQRHLYSSQKSAERVMKSLASGTRFSGENSADFTIAEHLRGQKKGMESAKRNAESASSFVQVAEGGLNEQNNILIRMRELSIQAASDTFSDTEREMMNLEFQQLSEELDRIAQTTSFGSNKLLNGSDKEYEFQVGAYKGDENVLKYSSDTNTSRSELGVDSARVSDKSDARDSLETIDNALTKIAQARANFGAVQSRLDSVINNAAVQVENLSAAHSQIADTDIAQAVSEMTKQQALMQYQVSVLSQANQTPGQILRLIA